VVCVKVYILADNIVNKRGLVAEHGLSIFVEHQELKILFDTGQSSVYCHNAGLMGIDLAQTDCIILSHGHYDHCDGLIHLPHMDTFPMVYVHPAAFEKRFNAGSGKSIGISWNIDDYPIIRNRLFYNQKQLSPYPGVHLLTEIPISTDLEDTPQGFSKESSGQIVVDNFIDEQALIIEISKGLVVFLGCSHPGIISCLDYIQEMFPDQSIYALFAGMHMEKATPLRMQLTIQYMLNSNISKIVPLHCTGIVVISEMKRALEERCLILTTGDVLEL
jgi:7,8-dihydropterin-6-yl-methyl-4-(beta-D-ribofuranosyl)aminobenzene 5'-phosphate synthase